MKFLVDECLGPELTLMVRSRGHDESSHVVWLGKGGIKDWELMRIVLAGGLDAGHQEFPRLPWPTQCS